MNSPALIQFGRADGMTRIDGLSIACDRCGQRRCCCRNGCRAEESAAGGIAKSVL